MPEETNHLRSEAFEGERGGADSPVASQRERPPRRPTDDLPLEMTSFVGREREVAEIEGLLSDRRLLTLCGPGGSGQDAPGPSGRQGPARGVRGRGLVGGACLHLRP
jgi:hypothetical protein